MTRTAADSVQHLALGGIYTLQILQPLGGATSTLGRAAEVEQKQDDGQRDEGKACRESVGSSVYLIWPFTLPPLRPKR